MNTAHVAMRKRTSRKPDSCLTWLSGLTKREFRNPVPALLKRCARKCLKKKEPKA